MLLCCVSFICCSNGKSGEDEGLQPAMSMKILTSSASSVTLRVESVNASHYRILCAATNDESSRTARQVFDEGKTYTGNRIVIDGLSKLTTYTVFAVACNDKGDFGTLQSVKFTTEATDPTMYAWEQSRGGILSFSDLVLCYGGSSHRTPYRWDKQRFAPFVTYTDKQGKEHWLFDSFLAIEFQVTSSIDSKPYSYMVGLKLTSAAKPQWQELIDYWFDKDNGINALEEAVKEAAQRMGTAAVQTQSRHDHARSDHLQGVRRRIRIDGLLGRTERPHNEFCKCPRPHSGLQVVYRPGAQEIQ